MALDEKNVEYISGVVESILENDLVSMQKEFEEKSAMIENSFLKRVNELFEYADKLQENNEKGEIQFFHICYLKTCALTKQYYLQLSLYDSRFYLDPIEVSKKWEIPFIFNYFEKEWIEIERLAKKKIYHYTYSQGHDIKMALHHMYCDIVGDMIEAILPNINKADYFEKCKKTEQFCVMYSEYMVPGKVMKYKECEM